MTPKEKAEELISRLKNTSILKWNYKGHGEYEVSLLEGAKINALICVDEILQTNPTIKGTSEDLITMIVQTKDYWYQVIEELEKY